MLGTVLGALHKLISFIPHKSPSKWDSRHLPFIDKWPEVETSAQSPNDAIEPEDNIKATAGTAHHTASKTQGSTDDIHLLTSLQKWCQKPVPLNSKKDSYSDFFLVRKNEETTILTIFPFHWSRAMLRIKNPNVYKTYISILAP